MADRPIIDEELSRLISPGSSKFRVFVIGEFPPELVFREKGFD